MERVLVVEDDRSVQKALTRLFESEGYQIKVAGDGPAGLAAFREEPPSVVVLDLRLPGMPGSDVCRHIKTENGSVPIIVLSAATDVTDKVLLLELGADDYVTKPFSLRELRARIRAMLRRNVTEASSEVHRFGRFELDLARFELRRDGKQLEATHTELKLLTAFIRSRGRVLTREHLLESVWGSGVFVTDRVVDYHIVALRKKIEDDPAAPKHLISIRGVGYRFDG
jgi:DNA-binding response OmpR family regulator